MGFNQIKMYTFRYIFKKMSSSDNDSSVLDSEDDFDIEESEKAKKSKKIKDKKKKKIPFTFVPKITKVTFRSEFDKTKT